MYKYRYFRIFIRGINNDHFWRIVGLRKLIHLLLNFKRSDLKNKDWIKKTLISQITKIIFVVKFVKCIVVKFVGR